MQRFFSPEAHHFRTIVASPNPSLYKFRVILSHKKGFPVVQALINVILNPKTDTYLLCREKNELIPSRPKHPMAYVGIPRESCAERNKNLVSIIYLFPDDFALRSTGFHLETIP